MNLFIYLSILICIPYINIFFLFYQCCEHWVYPPVAWQTLSQPTTRTAAWLSTSILTKKGILWTISMTPSGEIPISRVIVSFFCLSLLFSISFNDSLIGQFWGSRLGSAQKMRIIKNVYRQLGNDVLFNQRDRRSIEFPNSCKMG